MKIARTLLELQRSLFTAILWLVCTFPVHASLQSDLASSSQETRDAAAKILRETYVAPSRTNWNSLIATVRPGIQETNVLKILSPYTNSVEGGDGSGAMECVRYRLDDLWLLECCYAVNGSDKRLSHVTLIEQLRRVNVDAPLGFSGSWTTYYVNGQKSGEGWYKMGKAEGVGFGFYADGSKMVVNHSSDGALNGDETSFYPSGRIKKRGSYKGNVQIGTWIWYNEDGSVQSKQAFPKP